MKNKDFKQLQRARREHLATQRLTKQWNKRLADAGLSVEQGRDKRLLYVGNLTELVILEKYQQEGTKE